MFKKELTLHMELDDMNHAPSWYVDEIEKRYDLRCTAIRSDGGWEYDFVFEGKKREFMRLIKDICESISDCSDLFN